MGETVQMVWAISLCMISSMIYKIFSIGIKYNINIIKNAIFGDDVLPSLNVKHFRSTLIASGPTQNSQNSPPRPFRKFANDQQG